MDAGDSRPTARSCPFAGSATAAAAAPPATCPAGAASQQRAAAAPPAVCPAGFSSLQNAAGKQHPEPEAAPSLIPEPVVNPQRIVFEAAMAGQLGPLASAELSAVAASAALDGTPLDV